MVDDARKPPTSGASATAFPVTIFLGAFLLFQVQPLIGKALLPWFGGAAAVWTTALMFFQALLFLGYTYAHTSVRRLSPRWQRRLHLALLAAALATLPIIPSESWKPLGGEDPIALLLGALAVTVGLPFLVLSSTAPLMHAWLRPPRATAVVVPTVRAVERRGVDRTPQLSVRRRAAAVVARPNVDVDRDVRAVRGDQRLPRMDGRRHPRHGRGPRRGRQPRGRAPDVRSGRAVGRSRGVRRSSCSWGVTNQLCLNVARVPFLWIVPLGVYLVTFMLAFGSVELVPARELPRAQRTRAPRDVADGRGRVPGFPAVVVPAAHGLVRRTVHRLHDVPRRAPSGEDRRSDT